MTEETKLKISLAKRGKRCSPNTEFTKGLIPWNKGRPCSETTKEKLRQHNLGKHHSESTKALLRQMFRGDKNPHWRGGRKSEADTIRRSHTYREWRKHVFIRDDYTCQSCNKRGGDLEADHELPFSLFPELRFEILNGRTFCRPCHQRTPTYGDLRAIKALHMFI